MRILVLGAGRVGLPMAIDLAEDPQFSVTVADIDQKNLASAKKQARLKIIQADVSKTPEATKLIREYDLVVNAVPGYMGYSVCKQAIMLGKNLVDIAFFPEDPLPLDEIAREKGVTAVVDCGVAPGMSNLLVGHVFADEFDEN